MLRATKQALTQYSLQMTSTGQLEMIYDTLEGLDHNTKSSCHLEDGGASWSEVMAAPPSINN